MTKEMECTICGNMYPWDELHEIWHEMAEDISGYACNCCQAGRKYEQRHHAWKEKARHEHHQKQKNYIERIIDELKEALNIGDN